jgi:hypothetical protein
MANVILKGGYEITLLCFTVWDPSGEIRPNIVDCIYSSFNNKKSLNQFYSIRLPQPLPFLLSKEVDMFYFSDSG